MTCFVWEALDRARAAVQSIVATERAEDDRGRRGAREFWYPSASAVLAAAKAAMQAEHLLLVPLKIGPSFNGSEGAELRIVFGLIRADAGEQVEFETTWPLANAADFFGRPQAQAATVTTAEKHQLLHLLAIEVQQPARPAPGLVVDADRLARKLGVSPPPTAAQRHGTDLEHVGEMPSWDSLPAVEPPPLLAASFRKWQSYDLHHRLPADRDADPTTWAQLVGRVLHCSPRATTNRHEDETIRQFLDDARERRRTDDSSPAWEPCTGMTAKWCPRCGLCTCSGTSLDDNACLLHGPQSMHAEVVLG